MIAIIDYGVGNLRNVERAVQHVGGQPIITADPKVIANVDALILPGVGAFEEAMGKLEQSGTVALIKDAIHRNKPFLGICLGMQMLFDYSEEGHGNVPGLGIFKGSVKRFLPMEEGGNRLKIPQIGWNSIHLANDAGLFNGTRDGEYYYFVHSFYVESDDRQLVAATAEYGIDFDAAIGSGNVFATQFHPEKSGSAGLRLLENFVKITNRERGRQL